MPKSIQEINEELARKINEEALRNPQSQYAGKFVGIEDGQVVVVAGDWNEVMRRLNQSGVDSSRQYCLEASINYDEPQDIWSLG